MPQAKHAVVEFALHWQSAAARHVECVYFEKVNFWRDFFPGTLGEPLAACDAAGSVAQSFAPGELVAHENPGDRHRVRPENIRLQLRRGEMLVPHTGFYADNPFARLDERADKLFYLQPRFVQHLDARVRDQFTALYARFLKPGMQVLDLMASWVSHLPEDELTVTGLGLNQAELELNPRLNARVVHDLNEQPVPPFPDAHFDAAVCTASVECLVQPFAMFPAVRRVLKPGAPFVLTFSERWFPPKVIQLWPALHPFERFGMVLDYFQRAGGFADLGSETARGWPRPANDKYAHQLPEADPVYAAWERVA